jgi:hypothetical protein
MRATILVALSLTMAASAAMAQVGRGKGTDAVPKPASASPSTAAPAAMHIHKGFGAAGILSVQMVPATAKSGQQVHLTILLNHGAQMPLKVKLATKGEGLVLPKQVTIPRGVRKFDLEARCSAVKEKSQVTITASHVMPGKAQPVERKAELVVLAMPKAPATTKAKPAKG